MPDSSRGSVAELVTVVTKGVAFYNSALPKAVRDLLESSMKAGECCPQEL